MEARRNNTIEADKRPQQEQSSVNPDKLKEVAEAHKRKKLQSELDEEIDAREKGLGIDD